MPAGIEGCGHAPGKGVWMKHWLVMHGSDGAERPFHVSKPRMVIGREPTCDLRVPLASVAQKHCQITLDEAGALRLKNLTGEATTSHNGQPVQDEAALSHGDTLNIGPVTFVVRITQTDDGEAIGGQEIIIERRDG
jgi:pSer/pThr/pTyr-binding forkhead associated (FHA) protein